MLSIPIILHICLFVQERLHQVRVRGVIFITGKCTNHMNNTDVYGRLYATDINQNVDKTLTTQVYNSVIREPDVIAEDTTYMNQIATILNSGTGYYDTITNFRTTLQNEFKAMQKSVAKYGGFWVGRYETSGLSTSASATLKVRADTNTNGQYNWYHAYALQKKYVYGTGTPSDTPNGITYGTGDRIQRCIGGMITGSAYDRMILFIGDEASETGHVHHNYTTDYSTGGVNYYDTVSTNHTFTSYNDKMKNIYDLEGHRREWTTEAYSTDRRVVRGGDNNLSFEADYRTSVNPSQGVSGANLNPSSRMVLFIPAE